jgi:tetratricopeptide (TPR) repeat protein
MVQLSNILHKLEKLGKPRDSTPQISLGISAIDQITEGLIDILDKNETFTIEIKEIGLSLKANLNQESRRGSNGEGKFAIEVNLAESQEEGMMLMLTGENSQRLFRKLVEEAKPFLQVKLIKNFEIEENSQQANKAKPKKNDEPSVLIFTGQIDLSGLKRLGVLTADISTQVTLGAVREDLKSHLAGDESFVINFQIQSSEAIIKNMQLAETVSKLSAKPQKTSGLKIEDVIRELVVRIKSIIPSVISDYLASFEQKTSSKDDFKKLNAFTEQQKINVIYNRKMSYLGNFFNSKKSLVLQHKIKLLCERLFYDKITKVGGFKMTPQDLEAHIGRLLLELEMFTELAIKAYFDSRQDLLPFELKFFNEHMEREKLAVVSFHQETEEDFYRKIKEYEKIGLWHTSEKFMKQRLVEQPNDATCWYNLSIFYLRRQKYDLAEGCFDRHCALQPLDKNKTILRICFLLNRKRYKQAEAILQELLKKDRAAILENLMMSFIYEFGYQKQKIGAKYFRVARKKFWRTITDSKNSNSSDRNGGSTKQSTKEDDCVEDTWKELTMCFLKNYFINLVGLLIHKIEKKTTLKNVLLANIEIIAGNFANSNSYLDTLIKSMEDNGETGSHYLDIILTKACNCFYMDHLYEAEELFLKYLRSANTKNTIFDILLVMGQTYLNRYSYNEAKQIFEKLTSMHPKSVPAWIGLCESLLNLGHVSQAEAALFSLSKLEHIDNDVLCLLFLVLLKKDPNRDAGNNAIESCWEIIKERDVENASLLFQILHELSILNQEHIHGQCFEKIQTCIDKYEKLFVNRPSQLSRFVNGFRLQTSHAEIK